jgi:ribosomal protein S18 acetylase RimI-like enzyme
LDAILLEKVHLKELEELHKLSLQTFAETFSYANTEEDMQKYMEENMSMTRLLKELRNRDSVFYFAKVGGKPVGYLKMNYNHAQTENVGINTLEVERIYVLKESKGLGAGTFMLRFAIEVGIQRNASFVWLGVWEKNEAAINFYKKFGFEKFSEHSFTLGNDKQTDIMMKLKV